MSELARLSFKAMGKSSPNPPVACIITDTNNNILSFAETQINGTNHAEREAYSQYTSSQSHNLYVTLQPCTHHGKTPPCSDLILKYHPKNLIIGRVFFKS